MSKEKMLSRIGELCKLTNYRSSTLEYNVIYPIRCVDILDLSPDESIMPATIEVNNITIPWEFRRKKYKILPDGTKTKQQYSEIGFKLAYDSYTSCCTFFMFKTPKNKQTIYEYASTREEAERLLAEFISKDKVVVVPSQEVAPTSVSVSPTVPVVATPVAPTIDNEVEDALSDMLVTPKTKEEKKLEKNFYKVPEKKEVVVPPAEKLPDTTYCYLISKKSSEEKAHEIDYHLRQLTRIKKCLSNINDQQNTDVTKLDMMLEFLNKDNCRILAGFPVYYQTLNKFLKANNKTTNQLEVINNIDKLVIGYIVSERQT